MTFRKAEADTLKCCSRDITGVTRGINNGSGPFRCSGKQGQSHELQPYQRLKCSYQRCS